MIVFLQKSFKIAKVSVNQWVKRYRELDKDYNRIWLYLCSNEDYNHSVGNETEPTDENNQCHNHSVGNETEPTDENNQCQANPTEVDPNESHPAEDNLADTGKQDLDLTHSPPQKCRKLKEINEQIKRDEQIARELEAVINDESSSPGPAITVDLRSPSPMIPTVTVNDYTDHVRPTQTKL